MRRFATAAKRPGREPSMNEQGAPLVRAVGLFLFTSKDDAARRFISEDAESTDYIEGDVLDGGEEVGQFIFRKISNID